MSSSLRRASSATLVTLALVVAACTSSSNDQSSDDTGNDEPSAGIVAAPFDGTYTATIRRTTDGVPHITGANPESAFYGQGYASGQDYACTLADQILKVKGQRAELEGPGEDGANIDSDFAWRAIGIAQRAQEDFAEQPELVTTPLTAFVTGWNQYLADTGVDNVTGFCQGQGWLAPITPLDLYTYARSVTLNASSTQLVPYLGSAQPPTGPATATTEAALGTGPAGPSPTDPGPAELTSFTDGLAPLRSAAPLASNGWAIGSERATDGGGMLLANPHFPWEGELRFWESQLTVPGELDIYGAQLTGLPGVGIGFTEEFGWTHTVSAGNRFTGYTLDLVPGKPTTYRYDDQEHEMTSQLTTVKVKQADGTMSEEQRTLWSSEYGPILDFPGVGWTSQLTTTYRDANIDNDEFFQQYFAMDSAKSFEEFKQAYATYQGVPLFNTIAVSRDGQAWYADTSATPNLSPAALTAYQASLDAGGFAAIAADSGVVLLDGSNSLYQWVDEPGARDPGLVPYAEVPQTQRTDYVFNANDSFWLNNASTTLTGDYSPLHGRQDTPRSPRTRENATVLSDTSPTGPSGPDGTFDLDELRQLALHNEGYTARQLKDAVVQRCQATSSVDVPELTAADGSVALPAASIDLAPACQLLAAWDGIYDLDRVGAIVWRELIGRYTTKQLLNAGVLWAEPFDPADPVTTPRGLAPAPATGDDPVLVNLGRAVQILQTAGIALDTPLGQVQLADRNGTEVPIHGGNAADGVTNVVGYSGSFGSTEPFPERGPTIAPQSSLTKAGYAINNGTSFLMALDYTADGPVAYGLITYGETGHRDSPLYRAQTERFSTKDWRPFLFTDAAIDADPQLQVQTVSSS